MTNVGAVRVASSAAIPSMVASADVPLCDIGCNGAWSGACVPATIDRAQDSGGCVLRTPAFSVLAWRFSVHGGSCGCTPNRRRWRSHRSGRRLAVRQDCEELRCCSCVLQADSSIAGSIAAMARSLPTPVAPPAASTSAAPSSTGADDTGMNLLDFGDDETTAPAPQQPAAANGAAAADPLAMLADVSAPPAAAAGGGDDWAPFSDADGGGTAATGDDDWAAFVSSNGTAPAVAAAGDWDAFAGAATGAAGGGGGAFADPFAPAATPAAPAAVAAPFGGQKGSRAPLPMNAFMGPVVEPIPVADPAAPSASTMSMATTTASKSAIPEKDPFADLLG